MHEDIYEELDKFLGDQEFDSEEEYDKKVQEFIDKYNAEHEGKEQTDFDKAYELLDKAANDSKTKETAIKRAKKAYEICNDCLDAIIFLADMEENSNKALEIIEGPLKKEEEKLKKEGFFKKENIGHFYEIRETKNYMELLKIKGIEMAKSGRFKLATNIFEEMIRLDNEDNLEARYHLMRIYTYLEDEEKILKVYNKYNDDDFNMLFPLFILYYKLGNEKETEKYLKKIAKNSKEFLRYYDLEYKFRNVYGIKAISPDSELIDVFNTIVEMNFVLSKMNSFNEAIYEMAVRLNLLKPEEEKKSLRKKKYKSQSHFTEEKDSVDYLNKVDEKVLEYFDILVEEFPEWLREYINTKEMLHQSHISVTCGTIYSKLFESDFFFSNLDHSIAVALIIWHFTHDKKQTLAGLFHDIATPAFKHCVDFLEGDYMKQEATENMTHEIIKKSREIMRLLERDNIEIEEVDNYHMYEIADNDRPKLSADRLEYSLSNALFSYKLLDIDEVKKIYNDIYIQKNEDNISELGFKTKEIAEEFVRVTSIQSIKYREDKTRYSMQLIADILKGLEKEGLIKKEELYTLTEKQIIDIIQKSKYKEIFNLWKNAKTVISSKQKPENRYYVHHEAKIRYIDPLVIGTRISRKSKKARDMMADNLNYDMTNYVYMKYNFKF